MRTVHKYPVKLTDNFEIELPKGAQILTVQEQYDFPQLWALVNPNENKKQKRKFRLAGTGHQIKETNLEYINSFQLEDGSLVFHLFEII